ncbi:flagellin [Asaia astilbis]|uniref:flagellin n=1 Tax=Asaia astilbis TaxID=610244 RepID=UPI000470CC63|nr:flagellin [Asaia astilbis]
MSSSITQYGNSALSLMMAASVAKLTAQQQVTTYQSSTGIIGSSYADLGSSRATVLDLTPKISQVQSWQSNISNAQTTLSVTATALNQLVSQATALSASLLGVAGTATTSQVAAVSSAAQSTLESMKTVLNTSDGTNYVFAGTDVTTSPVKGETSLSTSTLAQQIASSVQSLSSSSADDVFAQITSLAASNDSSVSVFSPALSVSASQAASQQRSVISGSDSTTSLGIVATQSSVTSSASTTSTGSPIRDLMRDLMAASAMKGMSSETPGYSDLAKKIYTSLSTTISQLTEQQGAVGGTQNSLTAQSTLLKGVNTMLLTQLGNARDADMATVATVANRVQESLTVSYTLISQMQKMSLADYL